MWAAKLEGEAAAMYEACEGMCNFMHPLGMSVDGGKDSLSMAAKAQGETVKAPGAIVVTAYAAVADVRLCVTPDLKSDGSNGRLYLIDCSGGRRRRKSCRRRTCRDAPAISPQSALNFATRAPSLRHILQR